jgi:REP-associated tyrosine transposase
MSDRPQRLPTFAYIGLHRYFLTFCCNHRRRVFVEADAVAVALAQILHASARHDFAVVAYCFMPDHVHLLVEGRAQGADLIAFARDVKQRTGYHWRGKVDAVLWQDGYYDRVLRDDEQAAIVAKYILENPVRAGLVSEPREYPYSGSQIWTWEQLQDMWAADAASFGAI